MQSAHYDDSMEMVRRGMILHRVVIIVHILVASTLQLNDTVRQFKVLPRTNDCQPLQPNNTHGLSARPFSCQPPNCSRATKRAF